MNRTKIYLSLFLFSCLAVVTVFITSKEFKRYFRIYMFTRKMDPPDRLSFAAQLFKAKNKRWPVSSPELMEFAEDQYVGIDFSKMKSLSVHAISDDKFALIFTRENGDGEEWIVVPLPKEVSSLFAQ
ncbi:MAG TPA: hypothetical protein VHE12_06755 [bacterium]|nr:hypothetical protein [bacterium]